MSSNQPPNWTLVDELHDIEDLVINFPTADSSLRFINNDSDAVNAALAGAAVAPIVPGQFPVALPMVQPLVPLPQPQGPLQVVPQVVALPVPPQPQQQGILAQNQQLQPPNVQVQPQDQVVVQPFIGMVMVQVQFDGSVEGGGAVAAVGGSNTINTATCSKRSAPDELTLVKRLCEGLAESSTSSSTVDQSMEDPPNQSPNPSSTSTAVVPNNESPHPDELTHSMRNLIIDSPFRSLPSKLRYDDDQPVHSPRRSQSMDQLSM